MLDIIIHKHIDRIDVIQEGIDKEIEKVIADIDIDEVLDNPETAISETMIVVKTLLTEQYAKEALEAGLKFAAIIKDMIKKDKDIKVSKSKDPQLNKDIVE